MPLRHGQGPGPVLERLALPQAEREGSRATRVEMVRGSQGHPEVSGKAPGVCATTGQRPAPPHPASDFTHQGLSVRLCEMGTELAHSEDEGRHAFKHFTRGQTHRLGLGTTSSKASWGHPPGQATGSFWGRGQQWQMRTGGQERAWRTHQAGVVQAGAWARGQQAARG